MTPKSAFSSFATKSKDIEKGVSVVITSNPKHKDSDDFIPLVDLESANRSHLNLSIGPHNSNSTFRSEPDLCHHETQAQD